MSTRPTAAEAPWQIEVDRGDGEPADYFSIKSLKLAGQNMVLVLSDGEQVTLKNRKIRKLLVMRTKTSGEA